MTTLGDTSLRLLTRGKVNMKIWAEGAEEFALQGPITARATCNVYSTVLTEPKGIQSAQGVIPHNYGSGWGLLTISNDGDFKYEILSHGLMSPVKSVTLQTKHRKKPRTVEDLTSNYNDGWTNGTYGRPTFSDLDSLLRGRLEIIVTSSEGEKLNGHLSPVAITDALRSPKPILLSSIDSWMAATAWIAVDSNCIMHYDIKIGGNAPEKTNDPTWRLELRENDTTWDPRLEQKIIPLEEMFVGREVSAHSNLLSQISLSRIKAKVTYLDLKVLPADVQLTTTAETPPLSILTGLITGVDVPSNCLVDSFTNQVDVLRCKKHPNAPDCLLDPKVTHGLSKKCIDNGK